MSRTDFLENDGNEVFYTNPLGRLLSLIVKSDRVDKYINMQESGWKFIKPLKRDGESCVSCEG